ncbi:MAG: serine hydrolase domain-containing protein [Thermomicrobiales bacterium]
MAQRTLAESEARGMAIGIATRDGRRILRTYGFANCDAQLPVREETLFEIGSISKCVLGIVFMQLEAEGKIDLHAPVTDYLPWFAVRSEHAPITAHHLLCHTAGLPTGFAHRPDSLWELWSCAMCVLVLRASSGTTLMLATACLGYWPRRSPGNRSTAS